MERQERLAVFTDTQNHCQNDPALVEAIRRANREQKLILETEACHEKPARCCARPARVIVSPRRSFQAAAAYAGKQVCVLNFASASNPGGGVTKGASAQEEALCRCSTLYFSLAQQRMWDEFYAPHRAQGDPIHNDDCIYTPGVVVFKSDTDAPQLLPERLWYTVNVLTCAAPNLRQRSGKAMNSGEENRRDSLSEEALRQLHEKRMRRVLDIAAANGNEVVILGAFGCGAFQNPPQIVAEAMKTVVQEYRTAFETIEFAVYCPPGEDRNFRVFQQVLGHL